MSGEHELPTASVVRCVAKRRTPAAVDNSAPEFHPSRAPLIERCLVCRQAGPPLFDAGANAHVLHRAQHQPIAFAGHEQPLHHNRIGAGFHVSLHRYGDLCLRRAPSAVVDAQRLRLSCTSHVKCWATGQSLLRDRISDDPLQKKQRGRRRPGYGTALLGELAERLCTDFGAGPTWTIRSVPTLLSGVSAASDRGSDGDDFRRTASEICHPCSGGDCVARPALRQCHRLATRAAQSWPVMVALPPAAATPSERNMATRAGMPDWFTRAQPRSMTAKALWLWIDSKFSTSTR